MRERQLRNELMEPSRRVLKRNSEKIIDPKVEVNKSVRRDKRKWAEDLAQEAENAVQMGRMKTVYDITKKLTN